MSDVNVRGWSLKRPGRVTIVDVARYAGVSKSTVSLVLTGSPLVAAETRERVSRAMTDLGYIYHRSAAILRGAQSSILGMVINDLSNPFFHEFAVGVERACQSEDYVTFIANTGENPDRQAEVIRTMREHGVAGLVVCPALGTSPAALNALTEGVPVALVLRRLPGAFASVVAPENRQGARKATAHLIGLGHRRVAFIGGMPMVVREERLAGYRDALGDAGLDFDASLVVETPPTRAGGSGATSGLLALADPPTAALCFNDVVAIGVVRALTAAGRRVGRDFGVVGFDDIEDAGNLMPSLTSVAVGAEGLGERAARLLMRQIAEGAFVPEDQLGPAELVIRSSCGAVAP